MAPIAARKAAQIARNAAGVIAVELMAAAQGIDFHAPLKTSPKLQAVHAAVRAHSPHFTADRYWADEMAALQAAVLAGEIGAERRSRLADARPALLLADHAASAQPCTSIAFGPTRRTVAGRDVALGVERLALVDAVAGGLRSVSTAVPIRFGVPPLRRWPWPCRTPRRRSPQ